MSVIFEWWRDVPRYEQVRAAEDAAAVPSIQHRDLPEQVALLWASLGDIIGRVVRLEGEMDAGQDEEAAPAEGMRTERVTLEVTQRTESYAPLSEFDWTAMLRSACRGRLFDGESVRVVDETKRGRLPDMVARLIAERDAAKEECERLRAERDDALLVLPACCGRLSDAAATVVQERDQARSRVSELLKDCETYGRAVLSLQGQLDLANARVAELESAAKAAPAANAGGESNPGDLYAAPQPPRGWLTAEERDAADHAADIIEDMEDDDGSSLKPKADVLRAMLARETPPRVPPPPRGWLTAKERETVEKCLRHFVRQEIEFLERNDPGNRWLEVWRSEEAILRALLARSTPPRVVAPPVGVRYSDTMRHNMWIAAIRAAGGEVAE